MAVRVLELLARPWVGVRVSHLLLLLLQVRVETFSVSSCYRDRDKLRSDGPLGSYADFTNPPPGRGSTLVRWVSVFKCIHHNAIKCTYVVSAFDHSVDGRRPDLSNPTVRQSNPIEHQSFDCRTQSNIIELTIKFCQSNTIERSITERGPFCLL